MNVWAGLNVIVFLVALYLSWEAAKAGQEVEGFDAYAWLFLAVVAFGVDLVSWVIWGLVMHFA